MTEHHETSDAHGDVRVPILAVVGRPNVGKSTLVNRIIGRREAVVEDVPGVTRDRVSYDATWNGRAFTVVDTGGWDPDARGLAERDRAPRPRSRSAWPTPCCSSWTRRSASPTPTRPSCRILRKSGQARVLAANKVDDQRAEAEAYGLWNLGLGEPYPVSALHGRGSGDMLDAILAALPETPEETFDRGRGPPPDRDHRQPERRQVLAANKLAGEERVVVDDVVRHHRRPGRRAGRARRPAPGGSSTPPASASGSRTASGHEYYASLRTATAMERAEVAVLVIDGSQSISEQDMRIIQTVRESGRALVIAFNKWDLVDDERRYYLEREIERELVQVQWAPRINITARTGWHIDRLVPALDAALAGWETRVTTGALNAFLGRLVAEHPHPVRGGKQPRILFGTQARRRRRRSCCSPAASWTRATSASSSVGCARSSASSARRSRSQVRPREKRKR